MKRLTMEPKLRGWRRGTARPLPSVGFGYAVAIGGTVVAALARWGIGRFIGEVPPFITFYPVVIGAAMLGGTGAGILAAVLGGVAADLFFIPPIGRLWPLTPGHSAGMGLFLLINIVMSILGGRLRIIYGQSQLQVAALESAANAIVITDREGRIQWANRALEQLTGYRLDEAMGRNPRVLNSGKHDRALFEQMWERILAGQVWQGELINKRKDGSLYHEEMTITPVRGEGGSITHFIAVKQDITERRRAEEAVRASQERLTLATLAAAQGTWDWDLVSGELVWSPRCLELFGLPAGTPIDYERFLAAVHPADRERIDQAVHIALEGRQQDYDVELRAVQPDGTLRWIASHGRTYHDAAGQVKRMSGIAMDITERKKAEETLREQAQLAQLRADVTQALQRPGAMREVMQQVAELLVERLDGVLARLWTLDVKGQVLELQASAGGYAPPDEDHRRVPVGQLGIGRIALERQPLLTNPSATAPHPREGPVAFAGFPLLLEGRLLGVAALFSPHPLSPAAFETFGVLASVLAQALGLKLAQQEQGRLAAIVEWSEDAIFSQSLEGRILTWNAGAERVFGYPAEAVLGCSSAMLIPPERQEEEARVRERLLQGQAVEHYETVRLGREGRRLDVALTTSPIKDSRGQTIGRSEIVRDIRELVEAREVLRRDKAELERLVGERTAKLQEAMEELEQMSYSMVHDMRAPLRAMQSFAMMLEEECAGCSQTAHGRDYFRRIRESSNRLDRLITDALNYNQVVRRQLPLSKVRLAPLLRGMIETYPNLQPALADIRLELEDLVVLGNESLLTQCFGNLLGNAVKFVPPGTRPSIRVRAEPRERFVRVWVEDNGIGVPENARDKIFRIFHRLHREEEYAGTGIGLAIVRKAAERMGGEVGLESVPGQGSRFWVDLLPGDQTLA